MMYCFPPDFKYSVGKRTFFATADFKQLSVVRGFWGEELILTLTEDMILALAGQFKQLSHEPEKFR